MKILTAALKVDTFPGPAFTSHIICHCVWPVASLKNSSGFPMASKIHLIAYQPINNEEEGLCRGEMAKVLSPALWKQKQCTLQNILETLESCLFSALSHLHSIKDLEQKVKISNPYKLHLKCWEQLKCSCGCRVGAFSSPPCGGGPGIEAPSH